MHPCRILRAALLGLALSLPAAADEPRVVSETPDALELSWTPGASLRVRHVALPPGTRAVLPQPAPPGLRLESGGWFGHVRYERLVFEPGDAEPRRTVLSFVADPSAFELGTERATRLDGRGSAPAAFEPVADLFLNEATARRARAVARARPELRPRLAPTAPRGELRRRLPTVEASSDGTRWGGGEPGDPRVAGFEMGRVLIEIGSDRPTTVDRGDGTWRVDGVDGAYRLTWRYLSDNGLLIEGVPVDELRLTRFDAQPPADEVAILVNDANANGVFDDGDWLDFFGEARTFEDCETCFQRGDYTDVNGYVLDAAPGPRARMPSPRAPTGGLPASTDFPRRLRFEVNDRFIGRHGVEQTGLDHFYWCPALTWTGGPEVSRTETVELPGLLRASARGARLRLQLLARTTTDHRSLVDVNGFTFSDVSSDGAIVELHDVPLAASDLRADTDVTVRLPGPAMAAVDQFELDWIELEYPAALRADGDRLIIEHEAGATLTVDGFSDTASVIVLDVSDPLAPVPIEPSATAATSLSFEVASAGRYAVAAHPAGGAAAWPAAVRWMPMTTLRDVDRDHELVAIGPRAWLFEADGSLRPSMRDYVDARAARGIDVLPVAVEDLIDEFTGGIRTPGAVFYFLQHAVLEWAGPPSFALLMGDASLDYKNQLQGRVLLPSDCSDLGAGSCGFNEPEWFQAVMSLVVDNPGDTQFIGHYGADARLATVVGGDLVPDVSLGRLPVRSVAELDRTLRKIIDYEDLAAAPPAWGARVHFVGDRIDPAEPVEERIEGAQEEARLEHVEPHYASGTYYFQRDYGALDPPAFTSDLLAGWTDPGAAVVSYVGHGNALNWSDDVLFTNNAPSQGCRNDVVDSLSDPFAPLPIVLNVGCITGAFMREVGPSLLEELVRSPGGAIAAFGPTGLTDISLASTLLDGFLGGLHGRDGRGLLLGEVVLRLQARLAMAGLGEPAMSNALLGDPSLLPAIPFGPAADLVVLDAVAGDGIVRLSWPAVAGADSYTIQRSVVGGPDPPVIAGQTAANSLDDTGVVNGTLYEYRLEAFASGWPGRWSPGVEARPCSSTPPEPPANVAVSRLLDRVVRIDWDPSPSPGFEGYRVRIFAGPVASGVPLVVRETANPTLTYGPLDRCREYTYEVRTLGWCELESLVGATASARAQDCTLIADPPRTVRDLRLSRTGDDLQLSWSPIDRTVQGNAFTPTRYVLHRALAADFFADAATFADENPVPGLTLPGAAALGGPVVEFFSVAAESAAGLTGGLGRDFPLGVTDLGVGDAGTDWRLSWSPVTRDLEGERTALLGYQVHASATPLDRSGISAATLVAVAPPEAVETLVDKAFGDFHVLVAEDVHGNLSPF